MRTRITIVGAFLLLGPICWAGAGPSDPAKSAPNPGTDTAAVNESAARADKRYDEMLGKMQAAVEEVAQLYGNPVFLQVFTNDEERASRLKERLKLAKSGDDVGREVVDLQKKRDDLLNDIALKQREADRLTNRLVRQRAALEALAEAVEQARKAVEETTR
jgi:parvulin-like peptidyl-prolyl isomerase